jgi:hypothetical protein
MSGSASKDASATANTVTPTHEADVPATAPTHDENHNSTSRRPSLHPHPSSQIPEVAPVLGGAGFVAEPAEKVEHAATAFKHHPTLEPQENGQLKEKSANGNEEKDTATSTQTPVVQKDVEAGVEGSGEEGETDSETVYPGGLQLGLLTFGLCVATFMVALGK